MISNYVTRIVSAFFPSCPHELEAYCKTDTYPFTQDNHPIYNRMICSNPLSLISHDNMTITCMACILSLVVRHELPTGVNGDCLLYLCAPKVLQT